MNLIAYPNVGRPSSYLSRLHQAVSDAWLSEHPDGRSRDRGLLAEPGVDFGMPDLGASIPSDDRGRC